MTYRRKVRIAADVIDRNAFVVDNVEEWNPHYFMEFPPIYVVEVQVKVLFFWITIWGDDCAFSDADARNSINCRANAIYDSLSK